MLSPDEDMTDDEEWIDGCYTTSTKESGNVASICDILSIKDLTSRDFSDTTMCNYYTTNDKFSYIPIVMAFQVWMFGCSSGDVFLIFQTYFGLIIKHCCMYKILCSRKGVPS